jgi:hypothetical protein
VYVIVAHAIVWLTLGKASFTNLVKDRIKCFLLLPSCSSLPEASLAPPQVC